MDRTACSHRGGAIGLALAGALGALSCKAPSPPAERPSEATTEARSPAAARAAEPAEVASAHPSAPEAAAARATHDRPVVQHVDLPEVVIYGRVPRPKNAVQAEPDPAKVARLYAGRADEFELHGLTLTNLASAPPVAVPAEGPSIDIAAPRAEPLALLPSAAPGELAPLPLQFREDPRLPREAVGDVLRSHLGALDVCYAAAARLDPSLEGKAEVGFSINQDGHVERVETRVDGHAGAKAARCMENIVSKLTFTPAGAPVHVRARFGGPPAPSSRG